MICIKCGNDNEKSRTVCWFCGAEIGLHYNNKPSVEVLKIKYIRYIKNKALASFFAVLILLCVLVSIYHIHSNIESYSVTAQKKYEVATSPAVRLRAQQVKEIPARLEVEATLQNNTKVIQKLQQEYTTLETKVEGAEPPKPLIKLDQNPVADEPVSATTLEIKQFNDELIAFVRSYYVALDLRDVDDALSKLKTPPNNFSHMVKNIEYIKVINIRVLNVSSSHATVWVDIVGKTYTSTRTDHWKGNIEIESLAPEKRTITSLDLIKY